MLKKRYIFIILFILLFISFCLFINVVLSDGKYNYELIQVDYKTSKSFIIKNILPISDKLGKTFNGEGTSEGIQGYVELSLTNPNSVSITYDIYVTEDVSSDYSKIRGNYIKLFLSDDNDIAFDGFDSRKIPTFSELLVLKDKPGSRLLYRGYLKPEEEKTVRLRVWLSDSYSVSASSSSAKKIFSAEVRVRDNRRIYEG